MDKCVEIGRVCGQVHLLLAVWVFSWFCVCVCVLYMSGAVIEWGLCLHCKTHFGQLLVNNCYTTSTNQRHFDALFQHLLLESPTVKQACVSARHEQLSVS